MGTTAGLCVLFPPELHSAVGAVMEVIRTRAGGGVLRRSTAGPERGGPPGHMTRGSARIAEGYLPFFLRLVFTVLTVNSKSRSMWALK